MPIERKSPIRTGRTSRQKRSLPHRSNRRLRGALLASTALTVLVLGIASESRDALAQCTPTSTIGSSGSVLNTNTSVSLRLQNGSGSIVNLGVVGGDGTYDGNCVLDMVNRSGDVVKITVPATTTFTDALVLDDASTGNLIMVSGALGGTDTAIVDGLGANTVDIGPGADITSAVLMGGGDDTVNYVGGNLGSVDMGGGNDTFFVTREAISNNDEFISFEVDGGADTDTVIISIEDGAAIISSTFTTTFQNFENLVKSGAGKLVLGGPDPQSFETVTVTGGTLVFSGTWNITGNTLTVDPGATLDIGNGATVTLVNEAGNADVSGTLNVTNNATLNVSGTTTVFDGGVINVNTGAIPGVLNAANVDVQQGGTISVDGAMTASSITEIRGTLTIGATGSYVGTGMTTVTGPTGRLIVNAGGTYESGGAVLVQPTGFIDVPEGIYVLGGTFIAKSTTTVTTVGFILIDDSGTYVAEGATSIESIGEIIVNSGLFHAQATTSLTGIGGIIVNGGEYRATGAVSLDSIGSITVNAGLFHAQATTNLGSVASIVVNGGEYRATGDVLLQGSGSISVNAGLFDAKTTTLLTGGAALRVFGTGIYRAGGTITVVGGTVEGTGSIIGNQILENTGGAVSPGAGLNSIGTLSFTGTYQQAADGNFQADVQPGSADRFTITGTATLAGNVQVNVLGAAFQQSRIISTTAPLPTIFTTATLTGTAAADVAVWVGRVNDAGYFNAANPATGNNVDILVMSSHANFPNLTRNQQTIAEAVSSRIQLGTIVIEDPTVFDAFLVANAGPTALDQLSPEPYDSFTAFSFNLARQYGGLVDNRVRTLRCAAARGPSAPFCGSGQTLLADAGPGLTPGAAGTTSPNGFSPNTHPYGWSVWAQAIGSYLSKDRTSANFGYSGWTGGGAIGVDLALSQRWVVGVLAGGTRSNIDFSGVSGDGDLEAVTVGVYTAWYGSRWFANAAFTYSKTWVEADRDLTFMTPNTTANGKTEGDQYAAHATLGYGFKLGKFSLETTGGIDWVHLRQQAFTETGAGAFNLTVGSRTDDSLRLRIGLRVARAWKIRPNLIIAPSLRVGYAREVLDNTRPITSSLAGFGGSFTVNGDEGSRNILTYGGGIRAEFSQGITLYFRHSGEWAGDRTSHTFNAGIKFRW